MSRVMCLSSMTDEHSGNKLSGVPGKSIKGSWNSEGSVGIERLVVLCCYAIHNGVPRDMADKDFLVIKEVLSHALVSPVVDEILVADIFRPVIWERHEDGHLNVVNQVAISAYL